ARGTYADAGAAGQVSVRGSHTPVESATGSFLSLGECTTNDNGVSAGSESLTNITADVHAAVSNDRDILAGALVEFVAGCCAVYGSRNLRHANAQHTTAGTSCARSDADNYGVGAGFHQFHGCFIGNAVTNHY